MRDVSTKPNTLRIAKASAVLHCAHATVEAVASDNVPKANPLGVAKVAGIQAAKNTSLLIPYCHQVPLDFVGVEIELRENAIHVSTEVKAIWKTGVEMEALAAAGAAVLTLYDMLKMIDETMEIGSIKLVEKKGGKSDFEAGTETSLCAAVVVLSDKAARGEREDRSGKAIKQRLEETGFAVQAFTVLPDEPELLRTELLRLCDQQQVDLVITTGGTGLSPRDITPETTNAVLDKTLPGVSERLRSFGQERNRLAMLSRGCAGVRGRTIIVNLPGSLAAVTESMDVLFPWLLHCFAMLRGESHD